MAPVARLSTAHRTLGGELGPGTVVPATMAASVTIPTAGLRIVRIRAKVSGADTTLSAAVVRPDGTDYSANNPTDVDLSDGTEDKMDVTCYGEGRLKLTLTGNATDDATIDYIDVSGLPSS